MSDWHIFRGEENPHAGIERLPDAPPWRRFDRTSTAGDRGGRAETYQASRDEKEMVNAALYLRRPLLITGKPGVGKSSLAYAVARELGLGRVLEWPISTKSTLDDGLYEYDAIGRLQAKGLESSQKGSQSNIEEFLRLGPLGTAILTSKKNRPRVLLIDEIDKSDIDLPNDLLNVLEEGRFEIRELSRLGQAAARVSILDFHRERQTVLNGAVEAEDFPLVLMTSNGEREFPPAFLRRCLRLDLDEPTPETLAKLVTAHLSLDELPTPAKELVKKFAEKRNQGDLATDQLLNAVFLLAHELQIDDEEMRERLRGKLFQKLT